MNKMQPEDDRNVSVGIKLFSFNRIKTIHKHNSLIKCKWLLLVYMAALDRLSLHKTQKLSFSTIDF